MIVIDDFRSDRCQKIVPVIITKSLHSSKTFWTLYMTAWDDSRKNTMILSDTRIIIQDRIGTSVWGVTFHEMRKIKEIMKWKKNQRDVRQLKSIYHLIYIGQTIDEHLSIYIMTMSFCGRFDKDVHDIGRRCCSPTDVSTTEMKNLYWIAILLSVFVNFMRWTMRIIEFLISKYCIFCTMERLDDGRSGWNSWRKNEGTISTFDFSNQNRDKS